MQAASSVDYHRRWRDSAIANHAFQLAYQACCRDGVIAMDVDVEHERIDLTDVVGQAPFSYESVPRNIPSVGIVKRIGDVVEKAKLGERTFMPPRRGVLGYGIEALSIVMEKDREERMGFVVDDCILGMIGQHALGRASEHTACKQSLLPENRTRKNLL